jgi:hypothetical protein
MRVSQSTALHDMNNFGYLALDAAQNWQRCLNQIVNWRFKVQSSIHQPGFHIANTNCSKPSGVLLS